MFDALPVQCFRHAVTPSPVILSNEMGAALGMIGFDKQQQRKLLRILLVVIDAIVDKLYIEGVTTGDKQTDDALALYEMRNEWETLQRSLYRAVVRDGRAYILTSYKDNTPIYTIREAFDGRCGAAYITADDETIGINTWYVDKARYLDVYYTDRIEKYINRDGKTWEHRQDTENEAWPVDWTDNQGQPLGLALIEFNVGDSDIEDAIQTQRDINDALLDLMATSRVMGFPQRYVIGTSNPEYLLDMYGNPLVDAFGKPTRRNLTTSPGSILVIQGKDAQLGQLDQAAIDTSLLDKLLHILSVQTTVPFFYFTGGDFPSGVALIQAESRLNSKVESHQSELTSAVQRLARLSLRLSNTFSNTAYAVDTLIDVDWCSPQIYTQDLQLQIEESRAKNVVLLLGAGALSTEQAVRTLHPEWNEQEIQAEIGRIQAEKSVVAL